MTDNEIDEFTYFINNYVYVKDKNTNENKKIKLHDYHIKFLKSKLVLG